jgi:ATP-dependent Clp protease ATP-binding subunit ClpA
MVLELTDRGKDFLVEKGFDQQNGARPLKRAIQNWVEDRLAEAILSGKFHPGDTVLGEVVDGELQLVRKESDETPLPVLAGAAGDA